MEQIVRQLQRYMAERQIQFLFVSSAENVFYCSDLETTCSACNQVLFAVQPLSPTVVLIPSSGKRVIFTASTLKQYIDNKKVDAEVFYYPSSLFLRYDPDVAQPEIYAEDLEHCIERYLDECASPSDQMAGDREFCRLAERMKLLGKPLVDGEALLVESRLHKVPEEIQRLRVASRVSYQAMELVRQLLENEGPMTEEQLFWQMRAVIFQEKCQWNYTSLSAGPFSPDIYHQPCGYTLQSGDVVRMDVGGVWKGYGSDVARTYFYKTPKAEHERLLNVLMEGQQRMLEAAKPGTDLAELFQIGHRYIQEHGYPEYRRTNLGHSIGVTTEEYPFISPAFRGVQMEPGMVFSIETPYYIKDKAGFNHEDIVLITDNGCDILQ